MSAEVLTIALTPADVLATEVAPGCRGLYERQPAGYRMLIASPGPMTPVLAQLSVAAIWAERLTEPPPATYGSRALVVHDALQSDWLELAALSTTLAADAAALQMAMSRNLEIELARDVFSTMATQLRRSGIRGFSWDNSPVGIILGLVRGGDRQRITVGSTAAVEVTARDFDMDVFLESIARLAEYGRASAASAALRLADVYPVGSVYWNASDPTNPADLFGFGTWVLAAKRRMVAGRAVVYGWTRTA